MFKNTVQNNNLNNGPIFETIVKTPLQSDTHYKANSFQNAWHINTNDVCGDNKIRCFRNNDGSFELEFLVEFWPQRLVYIGYLISGITLLSLIFIHYTYAFRKTHN